MRLSAARLQHLRPHVRRPNYDRAAVTPGIVHLGLGAFHRAHQAVMTEAVLRAGARDWGILAASLRSPATRDALCPQGGLYTFAEREDGTERLQVIGALRGVHVAPEDPEALLAAMSAPTTRIVSLTVTEKGYCHDPASGALDESHPDIRHDLALPVAPRSAPGFLVEALRRRRAAGTPPFTVLSCDNLPANGATTRAITARLAALQDPDLGAWIAGEVAFPCTMVDRIVPATTEEDRARIDAALGLQDAWPVVGEGFRQWVIEDHFPGGRPEWEMAGAQFTADVAAFELAKLRMLNGAHSALAYLGYLAGHGTVAEAAADPLFAAYLEAFWAEVMPNLAPPPGLDLRDYAAQLLARFRNRALRHQTSQIAMDGSQKLPQRLLGTIRAALAEGLPVGCLVLGVAGWMRYMVGVDEAGGAIHLRDPMIAEISRACAPGLADPAALADRLLAIPAIFGEDLPRHPVFRPAVQAALAGLVARGSRAALREALG
ncbi:mannitol dehydrogenase family protein [Falsiroseomonas sp.]|uniref:mannitol dehydrogenase family protein n=1 Tax=Falsiroseomonas sp. TaxID=2870721 RepID=UPI003F705737